MTNKKKYTRFGELMTEGTDKLAAATGRVAKTEVFTRLAQSLDYESYSTIYRWRNGESLPDSDTLTKLAESFVAQWGAGDIWLRNFLHAGRYDADIDTFIEQIGVEQKQPQVEKQTEEESEIVEPAQQSLKTAALIQQFKLKRELTPIGKIALLSDVSALVEGFDFVGIKWWSFFAFTVGIVKADGLDEAQIKTLSQQFITFNNRLYRNPKGLKIGWLAWWLTFTMGGVLCFVFEEGCSDKLQTFIEQQQQLTPAYEGISVTIGVQTKATSLFWAVDLQKKQVYRHLGKTPDGTNYHARKMVEECQQFEQHISDIIIRLTEKVD